MNSFITNALWNWFLGWPWYAHVALAAGVILFAWGALAGLYSFASKIGGWKAGLGALLALFAVIAAIWPKRRASHDPFPHPDGEPVHPRPRKKRPTIFGGLRK